MITATLCCLLNGLLDIVLGNRSGHKSLQIDYFLFPLGLPLSSDFLVVTASSDSSRDFEVPLAQKAEDRQRPPAERLTSHFYLFNDPLHTLFVYFTHCIT